MLILFLYSHEADFIQEFLRKKEKKLAVSFNFTFRYIDDVISLNNSKFSDYVERIYPIELEIKDSAPACGVYISQLIRYSRACISYHDFLNRRLQLTRKLLNQELKSSLRKFYGHHHELVDRYDISVSQMIADMFQLS